MMMDLKEPCADDPQTTQNEEVKLLLMEMDDRHSISPSKVAQKHICAPSNGHYPVSNAFELFDKAASYRLSNTIDVMTPMKS